MLIKDDKRLFFGDSGEAWIRYDEADSDDLVLSSSSGIQLSSSFVRVAGTLELAGTSELTTISGTTATYSFITGTAAKFNRVTGTHGTVTNLTGTTITSTTVNATTVSGTTATYSYVTGTSAKFNRVTGTHATVTNLTGTTITTTAVNVGGNATASAGMLIKDDKRLFFGDNEDAWIKYDESASDDLIISSSSKIALSASAAVVEGAVHLVGNNAVSFWPGSSGNKLIYSPNDASLYIYNLATNGVTQLYATQKIAIASPCTGTYGFQVKDDKKLLFGNSDESYIKYDEAGDDFLIISGSASGVGISGSVVRVDGAIEALTGLSVIGTISASSDVTVGGNLLVQGTTVTQDVVNSVIEDPVIGLGYGTTGSADPATGSAGDRGLVMGISGSAAVAMIWDNSESQFAFVTTANNPEDTTIAPASYEDLRVSAVDIGGSVLLDADGATKVQHDVTGALGGLRHAAGKLSIDIKNLPSGSDMELGDLMVFQDGHASGSTRVLPIQKLVNLVTGGAGATISGTTATYSYITGTSVTANRGFFTTVSGTTATYSFVTGTSAKFNRLTGTHATVTNLTGTTLTTTAVTIGGNVLLNADGATKVQHDVTGALGGLKHDAGKLFVDIKNLPSGSDMELTDLMVFQDGHASGSTKVLPIQKLVNLVTGGAGASISGTTATYSYVTGTAAKFNRLTGTHGTVTNLTGTSLTTTTVTIGGNVLLNADGATKVQHDVTGALGGLKHNAGKLSVDIKNLPSGSDMELTDLMVFRMAMHPDPPKFFQFKN